MADFIAILGMIAFFGLIDLGFWGIAVYLWVRHAVFMGRAVTVEGRVVSVRRSRAGSSGGGQTLYHPVVRFEDEHGQGHTVSCTRGDAMWDDLVDTPLDVLVVPGRPEAAKVALDKANAPKVLTILAVAFALPVVLLSLALAASQ